MDVRSLDRLKHKVRRRATERAARPDRWSIHHVVRRSAMRRRRETLLSALALAAGLVVGVGAVWALGLL